MRILADLPFRGSFVRTGLDVQTIFGDDLIRLIQGHRRRAFDVFVRQVGDFFIIIVAQGFHKPASDAFRHTVGHQVVAVEVPAAVQLFQAPAGDLAVEDVAVDFVAKVLVIGFGDGFEQFFGFFAPVGFVGAPVFDHILFGNVCVTEHAAVPGVAEGIGGAAGDRQT